MVKASYRARVRGTESVVIGLPLGESLNYSSRSAYVNSSRVYRLPAEYTCRVYRLPAEEISARPTKGEAARSPLCQIV